MSVLDQILADLGKSLKEGQGRRVATLRFLIALLHNAKIAKGDDLSDEEVLAEIQKDVRKHRESIEAFRAGSREDLVKKEGEELKILQSFLPEELSYEELHQIVIRVKEEVKPSGPADFGKLMGQVMDQVKGRADGAVVSEIVKKELAPSDARR